MIVYCVTKFQINGPFKSVPVMRYLGTDLEEAIRIALSIAVAVMEGPKVKYPELFCALPTTVSRKVLRYHNTGDIWASVVEFTLEEKK